MASLFLEDQDEVDFFRRQGDTLTEVAMDPAESRQVLRRIAEEHARE